MKIKYIVSLCVLTILSCKTTVVKPNLPEIDFVSDNYLTPTYVTSCKLGVECGETPYWNNQVTKLQGFVFSGNINIKERKFFLYDNIKVFESTNRSISVDYLPKDSAIISKALLANSDKHCLIKVSCLTREVEVFGCVKSIMFTIMKPEDLEFK